MRSSIQAVSDAAAACTTAAKATVAKERAKMRCNAV